MKRTTQQNAALHKGLELLADALNDSGQDMKAVLEAKPIDVPCSKERLKDMVFKPIIIAMYDKDSTAELTTAEVSRAWDVLMRWTGEQFGVVVPFPSEVDL